VKHIKHLPQAPDARSRKIEFPISQSHPQRTGRFPSAALRTGFRSFSGLRARQTQLDATARNIANTSTREYKRLDVRMEEASGGVQARVERVDTPGMHVPAAQNIGGGTVELSNVELVREIPNLIESTRGFELNLKTLQTQDEMLGELLDLLG
jgi:flagellar basal-body rod protein FlgC